MNIFCKRLTDERKRKGWTKKHLGTILGVTGQTIGKYEKGVRKPDADTIIKLSELFNCSIDYLYGISNIRNHKEPCIQLSEHEIRKILNQTLEDVDKAERQGEITNEEKIEIMQQGILMIIFQLYNYKNKKKS